MNAPTQNFIGPTPADLVSEYITLRDRKKEAEEKIKEFIRLNFQDRIETIELELLNSLNRLGADNIKTPYGTAFKRVETSVTVQDAAEFKRHVIGTEAWELLDIRANKVAVREYVENNSGQLPPGVNMTQDTIISVRKATPKE